MSAPSSPVREGLRERHAGQIIREETSSGEASGQHTPQSSEYDAEKEKKTFGRTPDGTSESPSIVE
jgi:hypothetical protein